ncbi:MAG: hypothetical protein QOE69_1993 [Thermoleophilaceae bacterium]|nr:hypothetical protein [Thermoleophilaceae bacterium]
MTDVDDPHDELDPPTVDEPERRLHFDEMHPLIADAAQEDWERGDYPAALQDAWFALRDLARQRLNQPNLDGSQLMERIGDTTPQLPLTGMSNDTERDMHRGVWRFLTGVAFYVRNPEMHQTESPVEGDRAGAFERLAVMSICARHLEAASSPVAVDEAVDEASQPRFPATREAADDLIHSVPTGRRPELVEKLMDRVKDAADANDGTKARNLRIVYHRALHRLGTEDAPVRVAANRCGRWIADDDTLILGIEMVTPTVYELLERRHQDKVALAVIDDLSAGIVNRGVRSGAVLEEATARLFPAVSDERRADLLDTLVSRLGGGWDAQAYATRLACMLAPHFTEADAERVVSALVRALLEDSPFDATDELNQAFERLPEQFVDVFHRELLAKYRPNAPGAYIGRNLLQRMGSDVPEPNL